LRIVEDIASQSRVGFKTISGVHISPGSAETIVRRGGITNGQLIVYCLSNISAKNRLMCIEAIVCNTSVVFLRQCMYTLFVNSSERQL